MRYQAVGLTALLGALCGCGKHVPEAEDAVPLDQVPAAALKAAQERIPGVKFESAWKGKVGGKEVYEIRGKTKEGKIREVEVTPSGEVVGEE
ncbi:MAG: PepSY domain-containing protein [Isosphaeraceae bacterium]|nr:PepSY domain-containing protein [Isosphaeraceae bacterium]